MKKYSLQKIYWALLGLGFLFCLAVGVAQGQSRSTTFQVTPALQEIEVDPGDSFEFDITLINHSEESTPFRVYTRNFTADGIDGQITFGDDDSSSYAAGDWMIPASSDIVLAPDGEQKIKVMVSVPPNAEPGGHYGSVLFEQVIPQITAGEDSEVQVATRMASMVYFTVSGEIVEAGQVLGATDGEACTAVVCGLSVDSFFDHGPVPFEFLFTNTGNVHVRPKGKITIRQFGREVATIPVEDRAVLPNSQRKFTATWDRQLLIGPYEATLNLVYGSKDYAISAKATFWAFPWQLVLGVVVVASIGAGIFLLRKYHRVKRLKKSAS